MSSISRAALIFNTRVQLLQGVDQSVSHLQLVWLQVEDWRSLEIVYNSLHEIYLYSCITFMFLYFWYYLIKTFWYISTMFFSLRPSVCVECICLGL